MSATLEEMFKKDSILNVSFFNFENAMRSVQTWCSHPAPKSRRQFSGPASLWDLRKLCLALQGFGAGREAKFCVCGRWGVASGPPLQSLVSTQT